MGGNIRWETTGYFFAFITDHAADRGNGEPDTLRVPLWVSFHSERNKTSVILLRSKSPYINSSKYSLFEPLRSQQNHGFVDRSSRKVSPAMTVT